MSKHNQVSTNIDTPLLIIGGGPAALVIGTVASGYSLGSLIVGHQSTDSDNTLELDEEAIVQLKPHGVINVLRPYAQNMEPFLITEALFEKVLKHHCVVNMNITVYDGMDLLELTAVGEGAKAVISDGQTQWTITADHLVDTTSLPADTNGAIKEGASLARNIVGSAASL